MAFIYIYIFFFLKKLKKVEKIGYNSNSNFECNTERGTGPRAIYLALDYKLKNEVRILKPWLIILSYLRSVSSKFYSLQDFTKKAPNRYLLNTDNKQHYQNQFEYLTSELFLSLPDSNSCFLSKFESNN